MGWELGVLLGFFEGGSGYVAFLMWCFCGEVMVGCVVFVGEDTTFEWTLRICHCSEVYFRLRCGKTSSTRSVFGNGAPKDSNVFNSSPDYREVIAIVGDGSAGKDDCRACVDGWRWFHRCFQTPFFIAVHTGTRMLMSNGAESQAGREFGQYGSRSLRLRSTG